MQSTNQPTKFLIPFAQNDSAKVEIPATSSDPTRFSQSLGSPPLTGMPPEAGGVPPQLEDFNGALNQQSRTAWWMMAGGRYAYDGTWATDPLIQGYPRGAVLPAAIGAGLIGMGEWYNNTEANTANPDTTGTGWVPGYHYGTTALTGQTGGTVTLTPAQAAKRVITVAGTLTSNLVLVVPTWIYSWRLINNTGGNFTVTVKNAATAAVDIPQNGAPTIVNCDGTQVFLDSPNIAPAVFDTQPMQYGQATGRLINVQRFTANATYTPTAGTKSIVVEGVGGGGAGGGTLATGASQGGGAGGGGAGAYFKTRLTSGFSGVAVVVGAGGVGVSGGNGGNGGTTSFGAVGTAPGGVGGSNGAPVGTFPILNGYGPGAATATLGNIINAAGGAGTFALISTPGTGLSGTGGSSMLGQGANAVIGATLDGLPGGGPGAGGSGSLTLQSGAARTGGAGAPGLVIVWEYA